MEQKWIFFFLQKNGKHFILRAHHSNAARRVLLVREILSVIKVGSIHDLFNVFLEASCLDQTVQHFNTDDLDFLKLFVFVFLLSD